MTYLFDNNEEVTAAIDIARGRYENMRPVHVFGFNRAVGTTYETLFNNGGGLYPFPTSAGLISAVSDSSSDTMGVWVEGLDVNYKPISNHITLNGLTPVNSTKSFFRINKAYITSGNNVGNITLTLDGGVCAYIEADTGVHQAAAYTTPAFCSLIIHRVSFSSGTTNNNKYLTGRASMQSAGGPVHRFWNSTWFVGFKEFDVHIPFVVPPKTDICFDVKSSSGENEVAVYLNAHLQSDGYITDELKAWL